MTTNAKPLEGLLVADYSRVLAGPYCSMLLADMGATVIKVPDRKVSSAGATTVGSIVPVAYRTVLDSGVHWATMVLDPEFS